MIIENFNLNDHLEQLEIIGERKELKLGEKLSLLLYTSGQATLAYRHREIETFMWDEEAAEMFDRIDNVEIADLFAMMYSKRWISSIDKAR